MTHDCPAKLSPQSDVFSFGCLLAELFAVGPLLYPESLKKLLRQFFSENSKVFPPYKVKLMLSVNFIVLSRYLEQDPPRNMDEAIKEYTREFKSRIFAEELKKLPASLQVSGIAIATNHEKFC